MKLKCPNSCNLTNSDDIKIVLDGTYFRPSDGRYIQRYKCKYCGRRFSKATFDEAFGQNKRRINNQLSRLISSNVSIRRAALILNVNKNTISRKLLFLSNVIKTKNKKYLENLPIVTKMQFDDLQTIEHTKCKPLAVTMAVDVDTRKILGFEVSRMPATGHLAKISKQKYGYRKDERPTSINMLFKNIKDLIDEHAEITSDEHPYYASRVKNHFPKASYTQFKGAKGCVAGQGELKKLKYDPLFSINHTFAMLRANINRLIRKTWCTTKNPKRLADHLEIYMYFHNTVLTA